mgnify:CR=1 FL=1
MSTRLPPLSRKRRNAAAGERDFVREAHESVVCDIGQITKEGKRLLEAEVRKGRLIKIVLPWLHKKIG